MATEKLPSVKSDWPTEGSPQAQGGDFQGSLQSQIDSLSALVQDLIRTHIHNGNQSPRINLNTDMEGFFEVVSVAPSGVPQTLYDQVKIYTNSTTYRFYWYDNVGRTWHYVTATA